MAVRGSIDATLADWRPAVESRHIRFCPGFIEKYEPLRLGKPLGDREVTPTLNHVGAVLFRSNQRLLLSDNPNRLSARHTVDSTTDTRSSGINYLAVIPGCAVTV